MSYPHGGPPGHPYPQHLPYPPCVHPQGPRGPIDHPSASTALVLAIAGVLGLGIVTGIPAIVVGRRVVTAIDAEPHRWRGAASAKLAIGLGWVTVFETACVVAMIASSTRTRAIGAMAVATLGLGLLAASYEPRASRALAWVARVLRRGALATGLSLAGVVVGGALGLGSIARGEADAARQCTAARAALDEAMRADQYDAARATVPSLRDRCRVPEGELATVRADIDAKSAAFDARRAREAADREAKLAAEREATAAATFPERSKAIAAAIKAATAKSWQGKWEEAGAELDDAQHELDAFAGTKVAETKEHADLAAQIAQRRKAFQPQLDRIAAKRAQEEAAAQLVAALRGPKPTNSAWDGSIHCVERYLKERMHDPGSYSHVGTTEAVAEGDHWVVTSTYRGKNAFGALIMKSTRFHIQRGEVVRAIDVDD